ncbi:hypothetical protein VV99796_03568 [Vibrio vulnificus]|uniref:hypothetical protein n=1 Tax=Vibrio vulnificus TaxID=672 RepID=UPI00092721F8|nr:hypothetical protein [Vibrio vulnificus]EHT4940962.1 hypothetical protein [Vibrio vulnificus]OJI21537.1 hypothetical protein VV99796_03568 [Vibrio vulnificus]OJI42390.1 hypothetical protein VVS316_04056 [Vibrio vulnificus]POB07875.1 hypothetical protein CRN33_05640 [Vibrio vulnificus]
MKRLATCVALTLLYSAGAAANSWVVSDEARADFLVKFSGEVPKRCEMTASEELETLNFDLTQKSDKKTFAFKAWCNSYATKGTLLVDPYAFKNSNGDEIPMEYSFNDKVSVKDAETETMAARIVDTIDVSNSLDKQMSSKHKLTIRSLPHKGARWGKYEGYMWVSLYHM